jgi:hypothetical protein
MMGQSFLLVSSKGFRLNPVGGVSYPPFEHGIAEQLQRNRAARQKSTESSACFYLVCQRFIAYCLPDIIPVDKYTIQSASAFP